MELRPRVTRCRLKLAAALLALLASSCSRAPRPIHDSRHGEEVLLPGGTFVMGTADGAPFEGPPHDVTVRPFWIDAHEVTVEQFDRFVRATGYVTDAERYGWSGVFDPQSGEWKRVDGANWRHPDSPASTPAPREPVTQVSWTDAVAYARWAGKRLPMEAEWEFAARGGLRDAEYAWGHALRPGGKPVANWWQGEFPVRNTGDDGYAGRAPVGAFPPNGYGLYDMTGNVWEWGLDWFDDTYYERSPRENPQGPPQGTERVLRGGSWLCSENYCRGFRVAARNHAPPDSGLNNVGFRCVRDVADASARRDRQ